MFINRVQRMPIGSKYSSSNEWLMTVRKFLNIFIFWVLNVNCDTCLFTINCLAIHNNFPIRRCTAWRQSSRGERSWMSGSGSSGRPEWTVKPTYRVSSTETPSVSRDCNPVLKDGFYLFIFWREECFVSHSRILHSWNVTSCKWSVAMHGADGSISEGFLSEDSCHSHIMPGAWRRNGYFYTTTRIRTSG